MKNSLELLSQLCNNGLDVEFFYSIRVEQSKIYFQGKLTSEKRNELEKLLSIEFQLNKYHNWIECKNDNFDIVLTF